MIHIRFLNDEQKLCDNPARLDEFDSPVVEDFRPEDTERCKECFTLLVAHNKKAFEEEHLYEHNFMIHHDVEDPLSPARGIMWGLLLSLPIYAFAALIVWLIFR